MEESSLLEKIVIAVVVIVIASYICKALEG
jgi:hypothetical protein